MSSLRERIAEALAIWYGQSALVCEHTQLIEHGPAAVAVMSVVQPTLDARDADLRASREATARWEASSVKAERERDALADMLDGLADSHLVLGDVAVASGDKCVPWCPKCATERAEQAEAERDRLKAVIEQAREVLPYLYHQIDEIAVDHPRVAENLQETYRRLNAALQPKETP